MLVFPLCTSHKRTSFEAQHRDDAPYRTQSIEHEGRYSRAARYIDVSHKPISLATSPVCMLISNLAAMLLPAALKIQSMALQTLVYAVTAPMNAPMLATAMARSPWAAHGTCRLVARSLM
jgi:hypothetical protein